MHELIFYLKGYVLYRRPLEGPRGYHSGGLVPPFWYCGGPLWHLGPRRTLGAAGWSRGGLAQDFIDFGLVLGPHFDSFLATEA